MLLSEKNWTKFLEGHWKVSLDPDRLKLTILGHEGNCPEDSRMKIKY